jgi:hypothetical protein
MNEHPQDSDTPVTGAQTTDEQDPFAVKVLKRVQQALLRLTLYQDEATLENKLQIYSVKYNEIQTLARINSKAYSEAIDDETLLHLLQVLSNLDSRTMHLDDVSSLRSYDQMLMLSRRCLERQVECNTRERVIHTKLKEIALLEAEIMTNYGSEQMKIDPSIRARFAVERRAILVVRLNRLRTHWTRLSGRY